MQDNKKYVFWRHENGREAPKRIEKTEEELTLNDRALMIENDNRTFKLIEDE